MVLCDLPYGTTACKWDTVIPFEPMWSDLVRETGLDYHTIAKIESGRTPDPRISTIKKIADALKEPLEELIK